ncbi:MAG: hypothetical protein Q8N92_05775 [Erysipelotrichaceae bacterium]|nr:hypothetical protein [Erysipelotrichaceae bacterium]
MAMKKIQKIVVITAYPFNQRDYDRFGIELFRSNGLTVEIWDITSCLHKNIKDQLPTEETSNFMGLQIFKEKCDIVSAISSLNKGCIIILNIGYNLNTFFVFRSISKHKINYCVLGMVPFPNPHPIQTSFKDRIVSILKKVDALRVKEIIQHLLNIILLNYYFLFGIAPASIILLGGEKSAGNISYPVNNTTIQLWTHMQDYDIYLQDKTEINAISKKNGVFLDEYLPFHPDFLCMGIGFPISPDNYYPMLCNFFKILENSMKTEIGIAAHPRSDYENLPDYYCGRSIIKGKTAHLVKESSFVLAHMSTSIDFAVLYHKPILFITSDDLQKMNAGKNITGLYINAIAMELGKIPINIDHLSGFNAENEMKINEEAYRNYKNLYIKKQGTPEKPMWEIFCTYIQQETIS